MQEFDNTFTSSSLSLLSSGAIWFTLVFPSFHDLSFKKRAWKQLLKLNCLTLFFIRFFFSFSCFLLFKSAPFSLFYVCNSSNLSDIAARVPWEWGKPHNHPKPRKREMRTIAPRLIGNTFTFPPHRMPSVECERVSLHTFSQTLAPCIHSRYR